MDPGERTFQTLYGLDHLITIGEKTRKPIMKRLHKIVQSNVKIKNKRKYKYNKKQKKKTKRKKHRYKKAAKRHEKKIRHLIDELHHKTALYLCENYERIMVTDFSSKKVSSKDGNLNDQSKRVLGKLSHYRFRQCLLNKCQEYGCSTVSYLMQRIKYEIRRSIWCMFFFFRITKKKIHIPKCQCLEVNKAYTSKTCCNCGNIKHDLGDAEKYVCVKCEKKIDRNINRAINIFLKNQKLVLK